MAKIKSNTAGAPFGDAIPGVNYGILHPSMANRFRFMIGEGDRYDLLSAQTTDVRFDMVAKTIHVRMEQPAGQCQKMLNLIGELAEAPFSKSFSFDVLDGNTAVTGSISGFIKLSAHDLSFSYAKSGVALHQLVFSYRPNSIIE